MAVATPSAVAWSRLHTSQMGRLNEVPPQPQTDAPGPRNYEVWAAYDSSY